MIGSAVVPMNSSQPDSIIVYRSRSEQAMDQMLYDSGAAAWLVPIIGALIVGFIVTWMVGYVANQPYSRRVYGHSRRVSLWAGRVALAAGGVVGWLVFRYLAGPLL